MSEREEPAAEEKPEEQKKEESSNELKIEDIEDEVPAELSPKQSQRERKEPQRFAEEQEFRPRDRAKVKVPKYAKSEAHSSHHCEECNRTFKNLPHSKWLRHQNTHVHIRNSSRHSSLQTRQHEETMQYMETKFEKMEERMDAKMEKFADIFAEKLEQVFDKMQNRPVANN